MSQTWITILALAGGLLLALSPWLKKKWDTWKSGTREQEESWASYMKVQWVFMVISLLFGLGVGGGSVYVGPIRSERPQTGGVILDPRSITLTAEKPIYTRQFSNLDQYARVTVLTRTTNPTPTPAPSPSPTPEGGGAAPAGNPAQPASAGGTAKVTVHRSLDGGRGDEIRQLEAAGETWTQWEENNPKGDMSVFVEASSTPTTVELIIYLTPKPR